MKVISMVLERLQPNLDKSTKVYGIMMTAKNYFDGKNFLYKPSLLIFQNQDWKNLNNINLQWTQLMKPPQKKPFRINYIGKVNSCKLMEDFTQIYQNLGWRSVKLMNKT